MSTTAAPPSTASPGARLLLIFGAWSAVSLLMVVRTYLPLAPEDDRPPLGSVLLFNLGYWWGWAAVTPLIFRLGRIFPLERGRLARSLPVHLATGLVCAMVLIAYYTLWMQWRWSATPDGADPALIRPGELVDTSFLAHYRLYLSLFLHFDLLTYCSVVGIGHAFTYHDRFRERALRASQLEAREARLEASLIEAQLQAVRLQIQPHFLFNTLHAISSLMDEDVSAARRMMARLSELLRLTLEHGERQEVTLEEELELVNRYLEIEEVRFADRLRVERRVAPETLSARVPSFFLQPLIENALRHGIGTQAEGGTIELRSTREDGELLVEILDDGPGLPSGKPPREGIGLSCVRKRLALTPTEGSLELRNRSPRGLHVLVRVPLPGEGPRRRG